MKYYRRLRPRWESTFLRSHNREDAELDGALCRALLALAYAYQGEAEQARGVADEAVDILAEDVDSDRGIGHIRRVRDALTPYRTVAAVRDFQDRTGQLLKGWSADRVGAS